MTQYRVKVILTGCSVLASTMLIVAPNAASARSIATAYFGLHLVKVARCSEEAVQKKRKRNHP